MKRFLSYFLFSLLLLTEYGSGLSIGHQSDHLQNVFIIRREGPSIGFDSAQSVEDDVDFLLWTRSNPKVESHLHLGDVDGLLTSHFDPNHQTKVLIHGYSDSGTTRWITKVRDKYLSKGDFNIISVDWRRLADTAPFYNIAAKNSKPVGYLAADMISFLVGSGGSKLEDFHVIGFSLGAQVAGHLGYHLNGELSRVTGLDPAGPLFHLKPPSERLDKSDAKFVDVVHTAGLWIGSDEVLGHVDFYPNTGKHPQPGCEGEGLGLDCSHARAPDLFAESILSNIGFTSYKCDSWNSFSSGECDKASVPTNKLGDPADESSPGVFYLTTNARPPYAIHSNRARFRTNNVSRDASGKKYKKF